MSAPDEIALPTPAPWLTPKQRWFLVGGVAVALIIAIVLLLMKSAPAGWQGADIHNAHALTLLADPAHPETLYAGTEDGHILRSTDHGQSWQAISSGIPATTAISALAATTDDARFFAGTSAGVFVSTDQGKTWAASNTGLPADDGVDALGIDPQRTGTELAGTELHGVFRSTDGGAHWTASATGLPPRADVYGMTLASDGATWYAALIGAGVYRSTDGGATWQSENSGLPVGVNAFAIATTMDTKHTTSYLLAGTSDGAYLSADNGQTWQASNKNLPKTRVISLAADPGDPNEVFAGTDVGVFGSLDGGQSWYSFNQGINGRQPIAALAVSRPAGQTVMIFAAADRIYRYPGQSDQTVQNLIRILTIGLLLGGLAWLSLRQNRIIREMAPTIPGTSTKGNATPGAANASRSTIRGGPAPRAPSIIPDRGGAVRIATGRGIAGGVISPHGNTIAVAIMLPGASGGIEGPNGIYADLAQQLVEANIRALRLEFRDPDDLESCVGDTRMAIAALKVTGAAKVALIGWSFGASVAFAAGAADDLVAGVAVIAPMNDSADVDAAKALAPKHLLILHGAEDRLAPSRVAQSLFAAAAEPKDFTLYPGDDHALTVHRAEVIAKLVAWITATLE